MHKFIYVGFHMDGANLSLDKVQIALHTMSHLLFFSRCARVLVSVYLFEHTRFLSPFFLVQLRCLYMFIDLTPVLYATAFNKCLLEFHSEKCFREFDVLRTPRDKKNRKVFSCWFFVWLMLDVLN